MKRTALLLTIAALTFTGTAAASTGRQADEILWYLRGQTDALFAGRGWTVKSLTCTPRPDRWVDCRIRVALTGRPDACDRAFYRIVGHGIVGGYDSKPRPCKEGPAA